MHSDKKMDVKTTPAQEQVAPKSASRRRMLLKGGAGVAPVALSFISMPVRADAGGVTCRAASAFASITANALTSANTVQLCSGLRPTTWLSNNSGALWPAGATTKLFSSEYGNFTTTVPGTPSVTTNSPTLMQVLQGTGTGLAAQDTLAKNLVAAYLNNVQGLVKPQVVTLQQLKEMWNTVGTSNGNYPVTGVSGGWTITQVNQFLEQTFNT